MHVKKCLTRGKTNDMPDLTLHLGVDSAKRRPGLLVTVTAIQPRSVQIILGIVNVLRVSLRKMLPGVTSPCHVLQVIRYVRATCAAANRPWSGSVLPSTGWLAPPLWVDRVDCCFWWRGRIDWAVFVTPSLSQPQGILLQGSHGSCSAGLGHIRPRSGL